MNVLNEWLHDDKYITMQCQDYDFMVEIPLPVLKELKSYLPPNNNYLIDQIEKLQVSDEAIREGLRGN